MKTIEIKVYKFKELDEQTREKVIDNYRNINVRSTDWYEHIIYDFNRLGLEIQEFDLGRRNYIDVRIFNSLEETSKLILQEFGSTSIRQTAKNYLDEYEKILSNFKEDEDIEREVEILDEQYIKEYQEEVITFINTCYDWETSDEAILETIEANDYDFTTEGKIY
tara:strand:- start:490 stop:984 length:495 start_codon:yes stop_codon:yes gene_type:complete